MLVHLPIGFLVLLAAFELLARKPQFHYLSMAGPVVLAATIVTAAASVGCGLLLSQGGGYEDAAFAWHKWLGVGLLAAIIGLFLVRRAGGMTAYHFGLATTLILLGITAHLGGTLTHGSDYLTAPLKKMLGEPDKTIPAGPSATFFAVAVQPVFNDYCVACHGEKKSKAKLRLDTAENVELGGKSGAVIMPGSAVLSLLTKRLTLPLEDENHMPPDGKRQPTVDEVMMLRWWIDSGADTSKTVAELQPPETILALIQLRRSTHAP